MCQTAPQHMQRIVCNLVWERLYVVPPNRLGICWCRQCLFEMVPGPYGSPGWDRFVPEGQTCCTEAWAARGWFCRWCGKDHATGSEEAARGIYGGRFWDFWGMPEHCECGEELRGWTNFNLASCGSCWWVCTQQLVGRLLQLLGPWSPIHDCIWMCLIEPPQWNCSREEELAACAWMLDRIRDSLGGGRPGKFPPQVLVEQPGRHFCTAV